MRKPDKYPDNTNGTNKKCSFICSREVQIIFLCLGISEQKNDRNTVIFNK